MENLYESAFKVLNLLEEEDFEMDDVQDGELKDFLDSDTEETVDIIDPNAEDEKEVKDSYVGDVVLECSVCHSMIYKDASEILKDEESEEDLVNVGEECPYCMSADGYKIVGQIAPFEVEADYTVEVEPKEGSEDAEEEAEVKDEEEVEVKDETEEVTESFRRKRARKSLNESLNFKTMPIPKNGATFAFRATVDEPEISRLLQKKDLKFSKVDDNGTIVWLIGYGDTDHIATYVPSTKTLYTDSREIFRESYMANESLNESYGDGWSEDVKDLLENLVDELYHFSYEIQNAVRGAYTNCDTSEELGDYMISLSELMASLGESVKELPSAEDYGDDEDLDESLENIDIETEHDNIHIEAEEKEDADGEMIVPVEPDTEEIIDDNDDVEELEDSEEDSEEALDDVEVEEIPEEDVDIEEVDEESFDELGESFLKKTYSNVKSFKTTSIQDTGKNLVIEGLISFNSGNTKATTFKFTPDTITKKNKVKFFGENLQINNGKKSFRLAGRLNNGKLIVESLSYNYITKTPKNESKRVSGTVSLKEAKDLTAVEGTAANAMAAAMKDLGSCSTPKAVFDLANNVIPENKKNEAKVKALLKNLQNAKNVVKAQTIFSNFVLKGAGEGSLDKEISGKKNFN